MLNINNKQCRCFSVKIAACTHMKKLKLGPKECNENGVTTTKADCGTKVIASLSCSQCCDNIISWVLVCELS